jgi:radical SAM protein with 4Fe4S-binding SPASM domain
MANDKLCFADNIIIKRCENVYLAISIDTANWIVLYSLFQKSVFEQLVKGTTLGEAMSLVSSGEEGNQFKKLLAAIIARQFAAVDNKPQISYIEGYKMLNLYLTNACNLRCQHCFMHSGVKIEKELTLDAWIKLLTDFRTAGGEYITISGGEPLMYKDFPTVVRYADSLGLKITVLSNGVLWTADMIESLAPFITEIQISIDGVDENSNAVVRGNGHFDQAVNTVIQFANRNVRTSVATTFTFDNLQDDVAERYQHLIDQIRLKTNNSVFFKLSKKILKGRNTDYTKDENKRFFEKVNTIEQCIDANAVYNSFIEGHLPNRVARNCGYGGLSVSADGNVYLCNRISEVESYGNIQKHPIEYFIQLGKEAYQQTAVENVLPCAACHLRYICGGGCRIDDYNFVGKLQNEQELLQQITCTEEKKRKLERKMIESFNYYYKF